MSLDIDNCFVGDFVIYVPRHVRALEEPLDLDHPDCERGHITSKNDKFVFVRYGSSHTSQATDPKDLW